MRGPFRIPGYHVYSYQWQAPPDAKGWWYADLVQAHPEAAPGGKWLYGRGEMFYLSPREDAWYAIPWDPREDRAVLGPYDSKRQVLNALGLKRATRLEAGWYDAGDYTLARRDVAAALGLL